MDGHCPHTPGHTGHTGTVDDASINKRWDELLSVSCQHDDISPIGPPRPTAYRPYHQDQARYDDGSRVGDQPDYPDDQDQARSRVGDQPDYPDDGASISPLARGLEASPSMCRSRTQVRLQPMLVCR